MADVWACHGRVLVLGHSFVRQLGDLLEGKEVEVCGHRVMLRGWGGATVKTLRDKLVGYGSCQFLHGVCRNWHK